MINGVGTVSKQKPRPPVVIDAYRAERIARIYEEQAAVLGTLCGISAADLDRRIRFSCTLCGERRKDADLALTPAGPICAPPCQPIACNYCDAPTWHRIIDEDDDQAAIGCERCGTAQPVRAYCSMRCFAAAGRRAELAADAAWRDRHWLRTDQEAR